MTLTKEILKEDLSVQYGSDNIEEHKKEEELDIVPETTTPQHDCGLFDTGIFEYIDFDD